jgi:hypothetical protein
MNLKEKFDRRFGLCINAVDNRPLNEEITQFITENYVEKEEYESLKQKHLIAQAEYKNWIAPMVLEEKLTAERKKVVEDVSAILSNTFGWCVQNQTDKNLLDMKLVYSILQKTKNDIQDLGQEIKITDDNGKYIHLCDSCKNDCATCQVEKIVFLADIRNVFAEDSDKVIKCDAHISKENEG